MNTGASARRVLGHAQSEPGFEVPRGACDCHVHVFGPRERFPLSPERVYTPGGAPLEQLLTLQQALRMERVVIVQASVYGSDNACLLDALRRLGSRARGVAVVDGGTSDEVLRAMHRAGVRAVRVNLATVGQRDPAVAGRLLQEAASRVAPLGWHVETFADLDVLSALQDLILALPAVLVADHFGCARAADGLEQPGFGALCALLRSGRVYVKLSAAYRVSDDADQADAAPLARALIAANPDRVVWGSDWPHPGGGCAAAPRDLGAVEPFRRVDDGRALDRLRRWAGDGAQLYRILVANAARLYDF